MKGLGNCNISTIVIIILHGLTMGKVVKDRTIGVGAGKPEDNNNRQVTSHSEAAININGEASNLANLTAMVLANYDPGLRPSCYGDERVNLDVNMAVRQLIILDEPEQMARFNMWMRLKWKDCRIFWDPDDFDGETDVIVPFDMLWMPDLTLHESIAEEFYGFSDYRPRMSYDGTIRYNFPSLIEALCNVNVLKFPYDTQICRLTFGSWVFHGFDLNVYSSNKFADISSLKENVEWDIDSVPCVRHEVIYGCCAEPFPDVSYYVHLKRKPGSYVTNIIMPAILITLISALGFFLPVESGEKVALQLTVMLAIFVFQVLVSDQLPPSADSTPWISLFLSFTLVLCGMASLSQVVVINVHFREGDMSCWTKIYILRPLSMVTFVTVPTLTSIKGRSIESDEDRILKEILPDDVTLWMYLARTLDRLGLVAFILAFTMGSFIAFDGMISDD